MSGLQENNSKNRGVWPILREYTLEGLCLSKPDGLIRDIPANPHPIMQPYRGRDLYSHAETAIETMHKLAFNSFASMVIAVTKRDTEGRAVGSKDRRVSISRNKEITRSER